MRNVDTRIVATGLGVVSPLGNDLESYWSSLLNANSVPKDHPWVKPNHMAIRQTYSVKEQPSQSVSAQTDGSSELTWRGGRASSYAIAASEAAIRDAGLSTNERTRTGVCLGNAMGDDVFEQARAGGTTVEGADLFSFEIAASVATSLQLEGPNVCVSTACSAGLYSIGLAVEMLRTGRAQSMLVGGSEAVSRVAMGCFNRLSAFDPDICRPFDVARRGTLMGEGAAIMVLETMDHAKQRGAKTYAEVRGTGWSCDGHHWTIPEATAKQPIVAMRRALADAGVDANTIDCVLAHGTATDQNDVMESRAIVEVFGEHAQQIWVSAIKSKLGHGGGAAGAFQALTAALVLQHGHIPPTANLREQDPRCEVRVAGPGPIETNPMRNVLVNSYAFGGNNTSVILGSLHNE